MRFDWNNEKARVNEAKHGVSFQLARLVWNDPFHLIVPDRIQDGEQRWHAIGVVNGVTLLIVVHTYLDADDDALIRIISARRATRHERRRYEQSPP